VGCPVITAWTRADLAGHAPAPPDVHHVSAVTGAGLDALRSAVVAALGAAVQPAGGLVIAREPQRAALQRAAPPLHAAARGLDAPGTPPELVCVDVQEATDALGDLVGATTIEDVLDRLFSTFCIGK